MYFPGAGKDSWKESMGHFDSKAPSDILESYEYAYDKAGQILTEHVLNNRPAEVVGRPAPLRQSEIGELDEGLDGYLRESEKIDETRTFAYDAQGRLTRTQVKDNNPQSNAPTVTKTYTYDKVGNRLTESVNGAVTNYAYNEFNQLTARSGASPATFAYDANGNQISEASAGVTTVSEYDVLNRLAKTAITGGGKDSVTESLYNGSGQRIRKKVTKGGSTSATSYFYQDGAVGYTKDASGARSSLNIYAPGGGAIATERYDPAHAGKLYTYTKDQQGSIMGMLDETGALAKGYRYDDFGQTTSYGDATLANEICYTGGIYDESTGEYYLNARYYDPGNGRFLTLDTYRGEQTDPSTLHLYAYCANNPVNFIDPTGHFTEKVYGVKLNIKSKKTTKEKVKFGKKVFKISKKYYTNLVQRKGMTVQAATETGHGTSNYAQKNKNLFGITVNGSGNKKYNNLKESFDDYYKLLKNDSRYKNARKSIQKYPKSFKRYINTYAEIYAPNQNYGKLLMSVYEWQKKKKVFKKK
jgi:RHS repeat-associated protein